MTELCDFNRRLVIALGLQGGGPDDLLALAKRGSGSHFTFLAENVRLLAGIVRSATRIQYRFVSADAVITQARFDHSMRQTAGQWARGMLAGEIIVDAELCPWSVSAGLESDTFTPRLELLSLRLATLPELVAWCLETKRLPEEEVVAALGTEWRGRHGCIFIPCAGMREGELRQWWEWRGSLARTPCALLVARRE